MVHVSKEVIGRNNGNGSSSENTEISISSFQVVELLLEQLCLRFYLV